MVNFRETKNSDEKALKTGDEESATVAIVANTAPDFDYTRMNNRTKSELITTPTRVLTYFHQIYYFINAPFVKFLYHQVKK